jgi:hypothetical protein
MQKLCSSSGWDRILRLGFEMRWIWVNSTLIIVFIA